MPHTTKRLRRTLLSIATLLVACPPPASALDRGEELRQAVAVRAKAIEGKLIAWRRDIHAHPELGNQEQRTAGIVADHLRSLGLIVRTGIAQTGVVAVLKGGAPGPVVALRADMDALPVKEATRHAFASRAKGTYLGAEVDVMHACGHDAHVAILMAVAEVLAGLKDKLPGTVVFYFQPAEEGPSDFVPDGKRSWGAKRMIEEGAMRSPAPDAVFGLHVWAGLPSGRIGYRPGPTMASSDDLHIKIIGKQTHAGRPWAGIDPIVVGAQVILGLQTIVSRQTNISATPTVVSIGTIHGGIRYNIIPDAVEMTGTIRSYEAPIRKDTHMKVKRTATQIAESGGARAEVRVTEKYDPTVNDAALTERALPSLRWAANGDVQLSPLSSGAEDFSFMAQQAPGLFFFLGSTAKNLDPAKAPANHSPEFDIDEATLVVGVRALAVLATDFLVAGKAVPPRP
jgi:amidohydrolase